MKDKAENEDRMEDDTPDIVIEEDESEQVIVNEKGEEEFSCKICKQSFGSQQGVKQHSTKKHGKIKVDIKKGDGKNEDLPESGVKRKKEGTDNKNDKN